MSYIRFTLLNASYLFSVVEKKKKKENKEKLEVLLCVADRACLGMVWALGMQFVYFEEERIHKNVNKTSHKIWTKFLRIDIEPIQLIKC